MRNLVHAFAVSAATTLMALPTAAVQARDVHIQLLPEGGPDITFGDDRRDFRRHRDWNDDGCSPDRALWKAERMGIRRARIDRIGRRSIAVSGWQDGDRVFVRFDRFDRRCGILD